jgi:hypothetical protein
LALQQAVTDGRLWRSSKKVANSSFAFEEFAVLRVGIVEEVVALGDDLAYQLTLVNAPNLLKMCH